MVEDKEEGVDSACRGEALRKSWSPRSRSPSPGFRLLRGRSGTVADKPEQRLDHGAEYRQGTAAEGADKCGSVPLIISCHSCPSISKVIPHFDVMPQPHLGTQ